MKNNMGKRIGAILILLALAVCLILTLVFAVTGNKNFFGMLMITLLMPIFLWLILFFWQKRKDDSSET